MFTGKEIYDKRISLGWSAEDLATRLSTKEKTVSKENVFKWEQGTKPSHHETFKRIEEWLASDKEKPKDGKKKLGRISKPPIEKIPLNGVDFKAKYYDLLEKYTALLENIKR